MKERTYVAGVVSPNKYSAYLKDATVVFSDGANIEVTFPQALYATVSFPEKARGVA